MSVRWKYCFFFFFAVYSDLLRLWIPSVEEEIYGKMWTRFWWREDWIFQTLLLFSDIFISLFLLVTTRLYLFIFTYNTVYNEMLVEVMYATSRPSPWKHPLHGFVSLFRERIFKTSVNNLLSMLGNTPGSAVKFCDPGTPFSPGQTRTIGHPTQRILRRV